MKPFAKIILGFLAFCLPLNIVAAQDPSVTVLEMSGKMAQFRTIEGESWKWITIGQSIPISADIRVAPNNSLTLQFPDGRIHFLYMIGTVSVRDLKPSADFPQATVIAIDGLAPRCLWRTAGNSTWRELEVGQMLEPSMILKAPDQHGQKESYFPEFLQPIKENVRSQRSAISVGRPIICYHARPIITLCMPNGEPVQLDPFFKRYPFDDRDEIVLQEVLDWLHEHAARRNRGGELPVGNSDVFTP